ncbi:MAG: hypothetical protein HYZ14_18965 [Bacteroidetes bacterium]|nr:hypothetical protein [Bacteroidota bacterium]
MKYVYLCILSLSCVTTNAQSGWDDFTGEERAFFYNISRKTEILKPELFHLFEFTDSIPWINDTLPDYGYVEKQIVKSPEKLILHTDQIPRKSVGLITDLATAYAVWELDKVLHYRTSVDEKDKPLKEKLKVFETYVMQNAPQTALTTLASGEYVLLKGIPGYFSPSMSVTDKMAALVNSGYSQQDQMLILNAIYMAKENYVNDRSIEIFKALGGTNTGYRNFISAAGDGSNWSDLLGGFKTPYNHILPDDRNLYYFEAEEYIEKEEKPGGEVVLKKPIIRLKDIRVREFRTNNEKSTVLHFDVQGYHPERQTTIAIQKGGSSYILYGKNEHRLISPDSSYGKGTTYWRLLWELEHVYIADLNERLYGKRGYEYWISEYEEKMKDTELLIKKTELKLNELRHTPMGQPKMKKKKIKNKNLDKSDQINGHPTNTLTKTEKQINIEQNRLVHLNTQWENEKSTLEKLKKEMDEAYVLLVKYQSLLDKMQKNLGYIFMSYEQDGDIYTFSDGAQFNYATQEFIFPCTHREEVFHLYHITFGEKVLSTRIEETFVHINLSYAHLKDRYTLERIVENKNPNPPFTENDSIQVMEIFSAILDKELKVELVAEGGGIMDYSHGVYYRDSTISPVANEKEGFKNAGVTIYRADKGSTIQLRVTCWGEQMIPYAFEAYRPQFAKFKSAYPDLNEVDFYTGIKAKQLAVDWLGQLRAYVPKWFKKAADQAKLLKALKGAKIKMVWFKGGEIKTGVPAMVN